MNGINEHIEDPVSDLLRDISSFTHSTVKTAEGRRRLIALSKALTLQLEPPQDIILQRQFDPCINLAIRICIELKIFRILSASKTALTADDLRDIASAQKQLIVRLMRAVTGAGFATEVGVENYKANDITRMIAEPAPEAGFCLVFDTQSQPKSVLWESFSHCMENGFRSPDCLHSGPYQCAHDTRMPTMDHMAQDPIMRHYFNTFMEGVRGSRPMWFTWYPVEERLLQGAREEGPLMVDVAGGCGHDTQRFLESFWILPKQSVILQDLPHVIDDIQNLSKDIVRMKHDFFTPQPVVGARIYFFHMILHNWPDGKAVEILKKTAAAMTPGYSKLLINDLIMPDRNAPLIETSYDLMMLITYSALERSAGQWAELLPKAGLQIVKIWTPGAGEGIIEAIVPEERASL